MEKNEEKINPLIHVIKEEWKYLGSKRKPYLLMLSLFLIAGAISLLNPLIIGLIFNSIQESINSKEEMTRLMWMISLLLVTNIGFWIFHGSGRILEELIGFHVHKNYTNNKIKKILELPVKWQKDNHSGNSIDKINRARSSLESISSGFTFELIYAFLNIFGSLFILFFVDWKIATFTLVFSLITLVIIMSVDRKLISYYKELNKYSNKLSASVFDYISNIITVITLRLKKTVSDEINHKLMVSYQTTRKSIFLNEFKWGFASIAITLMTVLVLIYKTYSDYTTTGIILIGTLYILYGYLRKVGETFFKFASLYGKVTRHSTRINGAKIIDEEFEKRVGKIEGRIAPGWKKIKIKNLDFSYDEKKQHLDKINIDLKPGQKIALIGESGSGKSTILSLLRGLYSPDKGEIYIDNKKIKNGFEKLKRSITLIPQDPEIFNNTIKYNITMDLPTKKEELDKAISMAQFKKIANRLENGINTNVLEKGVSLSGGEKQRLALARGLLAAKKSEIILLDEPTSSVDSMNEMKIHENLFQEFKNKTIIASIHRLHLLNKFDYIYMFDRGKIIAEGNLKDIRKNPKFMNIWKKHKLKK
jgi:ATP-binding cassette, subfamily B, bacterial